MQIPFNERTKILAIFIATALILVWFGHEPESAPVTTTPDDTTTITGYLGTVHGDSINFEDAFQHTMLMQDDGELFLVDLPAESDARAYDNIEVRLNGTMIPADDGGAPLFDVATITPSHSFDGERDAVVGNTKWLNLACRFGDNDAEPRDVQYFQDIMENVQPGMDHYWRLTSSDRVNIEGSQAYGWYELPRDKDYYLRISYLNVGFALQALMKDCTSLAIEQDGLDLAEFGGINIMLNDIFGCCAWGGSMPLTVNGQQITFRTTWLPPWAFNSLHVIAHEMGHGWGLPHSSHDLSKVYDSAWDVMSGGTRQLGFCRFTVVDSSCHQVGTIGFHLDLLGWLPQERVITVESGETAQLGLDTLTTARSGTDALLINVPVASNRFITVEARSFNGYDRNIPGEAVVLHDVLMGRSSPALVISREQGDPNSESAMWLPGDVFSANGVKIEVTGRLGTTFYVRVTNDS